MADGSLHNVLEHLQRRARPALAGVVTDAQLLERFLRRRDEAAFELLLWRHGPLVLGVCRRVLRHAQDAEDAFQATFLVLARKAGSIGRRDSVSGWLYTVAYRIALRARARADRRGRREGPLDELPVDEAAPDPADVAAWSELRQMVDAELSRLPEKYRTAFVLCHLEGQTCDEAAAQLGCPRGTVQSRVGRAREQLRARLTLRGWRPSTAPFTQLLREHGQAILSLSPVLVNATVHSGILLALGRTAAAAAAVPASVLDLVNGTLAEMRLARLRRALLLALLALLGLLGTAALALGDLSPPPPPAAGCCHPPAGPDQP